MSYGKCVNRRQVYEKVEYTFSTAISYEGAGFIIYLFTSIKQLRWFIDARVL